jgi:hypothetical protein
VAAGVGTQLTAVVATNLRFSATATAARMRRRSVNITIALFGITCFAVRITRAALGMTPSATLILTVVRGVPRFHARISIGAVRIKRLGEQEIVIAGLLVR